MQLPRFLREGDDTPEGSHLLEGYEKEAGVSISEVMPSRLSIRMPSLPQSSTLPRYCKRFLFFLLPSFVQYKLRPATRPQKKLHPTAFLDGMRGMAAFLVLLFHLVVCCYDAKHGFASGKHGEHREFLKLPFIRIIYAGPTMVSIFFVVSGYALSYKPVKLMRSKNWKELMHSISSSIFRRAIRLFLPCIVSTFIIVILVRIHAYGMGRDFAESRGHYRIKHEYPIVRYDTLREQLSAWLHEVWILINPFTFRANGNDVKIDGHLWTIPVEFRSSLILYLTQAGVARLKPAVRISILLALMAWVHFRDRWELILFFGGFLCAELDFNRNAPNGSVLPSTEPALPGSGAAPNTRRQRAWKAFYVFVFLVAVYLGCQPQKWADRTPGWVTLYSWIPSFYGSKKRYWPGWGAILLVWSTSNMKALQRIFTNGPAQYLGEISFSMYIVHGAVTNTIGNGIMNVAFGVFGWETELTKATGWALGATTTIVATIWVADVFTRAVDTPSVKFARKLEEWWTNSLE